MGAKPVQSRNADFVMQTDTHVVNFNGLIPIAHLTWKGAIAVSSCMDAMN